MKTNLLTWTALLLLTTVSFLTSETAHGQAAAIFILAAAGAKCAALGWQFMELRAAHWLWRSTLLAIVVGLLGAVAALR
jgi:hypothetical protein